MDLKLLDDLLALHATGGFAKAARRRQVTQPTLSKRIRTLEDWVGAPLVRRHAHPVVLTEAGLVFVDRARAISASLAEARNEVLDLVGSEPDKVVFAAATTLSHAFFPKWITKLREKQPDLRVRVEHFPRFAQHFEALHNREVDYFLSYASSEDWPAVDVSGLIWKRVGTSALYPVCATDEAGRPRFPVEAGQTQPVPYVSRTDGSFLGALLDRAQARWSIRLDKIIEVGSTINLRSIVKEGHGIGWLTPESIESEVATGELTRAGSGWEIPLEIRLYRLDTRIGPRAEALWSLI